MTEYFEDAFLALETQLSEFDSFLSGPKNEFLSSPLSNNSNNDTTNPTNNTQLQPATYEKLLEIENLPPPSDDRLHSPDRKERIQAVRELYNKTTTILNSHSISPLRMRKVAMQLKLLGLENEARQLRESARTQNLHLLARRLAHKGLVKQANDLESVLTKHFSYSQETDNIYKTLTFDQQDDEKEFNVNLVDKNTNDSIAEEFDSLEEAIQFFKSK
jgi:hypothetical protein